MLSNRSLDQLTDQALLDQFSDLVQRDNRRTASLLRHIDAIDRRQLWAKYGHPSMFDFCVSRHHMSESTAGKRIGAARTARRFPLLFEMVARGEIHLSGIHRLKAHLTPDNHEQVLDQAKHKTIRQIEQLVAQLAPRPDVPSTLRALPARSEIAVAPPLVAAAAPLAPPTPIPTPAPTIPLAARAPAPRRAPEPEPLAPGRYKLAVTLDESTCRKLKQLQDLLAHQLPSGDPAAIIDRAFDALLEQVHKQKTGFTKNPRARTPLSRKVSAAQRARWIPVALRREVWKRDQGRCSFVGEDGHRCNETRGLEFAHVRHYGADFMAKKRTDPLKVREPVVRYVASRGVRGHIQQSTLSSALSSSTRSTSASR